MNMFSGCLPTITTNSFSTTIDPRQSSHGCCVIAHADGGTLLAATAPVSHGNSGAGSYGNRMLAPSSSGPYHSNAFPSTATTATTTTNTSSMGTVVVVVVVGMYVSINTNVALGKPFSEVEGAHPCVSVMMVFGILIVRGWRTAAPLQVCIAATVVHVCVVPVRVAVVQTRVMGTVTSSLLASVLTVLALLLL